MKNIDDTKNKILNLLSEKEKSSTELSVLIGKNYYDMINILNEMEEQDLIEKIEVGSYTYWRKKDEDNQT